MFSMMVQCDCNRRFVGSGKTKEAAIAEVLGAFNERHFAADHHHSVANPVLESSRIYSQDLEEIFNVPLDA
jgi:hypothetical protein